MPARRRPSTIASDTRFFSRYAENVMTQDRSDSSDKFGEFVKKMARLLVSEDGVEEMRERRKEAAQETGSPVEEVTDEDVIVNADDEFL